MRNENKHYWTAGTNASAAESGGDGSSASSALYIQSCVILAARPQQWKKQAVYVKYNEGGFWWCFGNITVESKPNASRITSPPRSSCQVQAVLDRSRGGSVRVAVAVNGYVYYLPWVMISLLLLYQCNWADGIWPRIIWDFLLQAQIHG